MKPFNFVYDRFVDGRPYPNLIAIQDLTQDWSHLWHEWPYVIPCRLERYCREFDYPVNNYQLSDSFPVGSFYPIGMGRWGYGSDYMQLLSDEVKNRVRSNHLKLLFYSHEGDDANWQAKHLDAISRRHGIPQSGYIIVTGNASAVDLSDNFCYFPDHELFYHVANQSHVPLPAHDMPRGKDFTCLSRVHKWWRATATVHLQESGLLDNSYWSYGNFSNDGAFESNPIDISRFPGLDKKLHDFISNAPYSCDDLTLDEQNHHDSLVDCHFVDSYVNIIYETLFDSAGPFLTEKTFKPIKHAQPFVLVGAHNSLRCLRNLGYKTFSNVIDDSYDSIEDPTERWIAIRKTIAEIAHQGVDRVYKLCIEDIKYNQKFFLQNKSDRLESLQFHLTHPKINDRT